METFKIIGCVIGSIVLLVIVVNLLVMVHEANKPFKNKDENTTDKL